MTNWPGSNGASRLPSTGSSANDVTAALSGVTSATRKRRNAGPLRGCGRIRIRNRNRIGAPVTSSITRIHGSDASVPEPSVCATEST